MSKTGVISRIFDGLFIVEARCINCLREFHGDAWDVAEEYREHECQEAQS